MFVLSCSVRERAILSMGNVQLLTAPPAHSLSCFALTRIVRAVGGWAGKRVWAKHTELFRHSCSNIEKTFSLDDSGPRTLGLKATVLLADEVRQLAFRHVLYKDKVQVGENINKMVPIQLNDASLESIKAEVRPCQPPGRALLVRPCATAAQVVLASSFLWAASSVSFNALCALDVVLGKSSVSGCVASNITFLLLGRLVKPSLLSGSTWKHWTRVLLSLHLR